ncbi:hypothetical protein D3C75_1050450 [compost metagenome]
MSKLPDFVFSLTERCCSIAQGDTGAGPAPRWRSMLLRMKAGPGNCWHASGSVLRANGYKAGQTISTFCPATAYCFLFTSAPAIKEANTIQSGAILAMTMVNRGRDLSAL